MTEDDGKNKRAPRKRKPNLIEMGDVGFAGGGNLATSPEWGDLFDQTVYESHGQRIVVATGPKALIIGPRPPLSPKRKLGRLAGRKSSFLDEELKRAAQVDLERAMRIHTNWIDEPGHAVEHVRKFLKLPIPQTKKAKDALRHLLTNNFVNPVRALIKGI